MNDLVSLVDWSRAQFALTALYHWLFVPLTIGLALILGIMETIYYRTRDEKWLNITKFWMTLFGINFACGIATGIILEFQFGTNWSNYSWFVGDIFGAPLAIEGLAAFFLEATFVAVMFFGWKKVSPRFHLISTWVTAFGVCLSALWILVANAWMQNPVGMTFDPDRMSNVMTSFTDVVFNSVSMNKFFHTVTSAWVLGAAFVVGVSSWMLFKGRNKNMAIRSIKVASWVGIVGILLVMSTGHGSAVEVSRVQPMKLAAMEGLYNGRPGQEIVAFAIVNPDKSIDNDQNPLLCEVSIPNGLSILAKGDSKAFVPGINDLIDGIEITPDGDTIHTISYAERIAQGKTAQQALRDFNIAKRTGNKALADSSLTVLNANYANFGYGYFDSPTEAVPPVAMTFYAFHIMVAAGGYLLLLFVVMLFVAYRCEGTLKRRWIQIAGILGIPIVWICSCSGWIVAEVGRQPWVVQDLLPTNAAISDVSSSSVQVTFWIFAALFTALLIAEISIMMRYISKRSKTDIETSNN